MQDNILLDKISGALNQICQSHKIKKVNKLYVVIDINSHLNSLNLYEYLRMSNSDSIGEWTKIEVETQSLQDKAIILQILDDDKQQE